MAHASLKLYRMLTAHEAPRQWEIDALKLGMSLAEANKKSFYFKKISLSTHTNILDLQTACNIIFICRIGNWVCFTFSVSMSEKWPSFANFSQIAKFFDVDIFNDHINDLEERRTKALDKLRGLTDDDASHLSGFIDQARSKCYFLASLAHESLFQFHINRMYVSVVYALRERDLSFEEHFNGQVKETYLALILYQKYVAFTQNMYIVESMQT